MKKITPFLLLAIFSFACALGPLAPVATPTPAATQTETVTPQPTATPVLPTLTFTLTPTLVGLKSPTPTLENSATPEPIVTSALPTLLLPPTESVKMEGFLYVTIASTEIYKAKGCQPSTVRVTAQVENINVVGYVLLFARFKSLKAERASKWTSIPMIHFGAGTYLLDLSSDQMLEDAYFESAWIEYQVVSTTQSGVENGRTGIYKERLKMLECDPTPTPTSANVTP
ncbi:MAG: hypothetical protein J0M11_17985 [Anaerolineae bacterium]|nr:hypothetical protein [Anaerolineae bacterium]